MNNLRLKIELVSPLFLKADNPSPNGQPILRAAPFRGALRYWLRAWIGTSDVASLKQAEEKVMGSTKFGSVMSLCVKGNLETDSFEIPHGGISKVSGFKEKQTFELAIRCRPGLEFPREGLVALLFWLNLGGAGRRARRGFGSLQCVGAELDHAIIPDDIKPLFWNDLPSNGGELTERLSKILRCIPGLQQSTNIPSETYFEIKSYPCFQTKGWASVVCPMPFENYADAMRNFWDSYLKIYKTCPTAFGSIKPRHASPVHLHISRSEKDYHLVLTAFFAQPTTPQQVKPIHNLLATFCQNNKGVVFYG